MSNEACEKAAICTVKLVTIEDQPKKERRFRALISTPFWIDRWGNRLHDEMGAHGQQVFHAVMAAAEGNIMAPANKDVILGAQMWMAGMVQWEDMKTLLAA